MLQVPTPFPAVGSEAFAEAVPDCDLTAGEPLRILQRNADGTCLCQRTGPAHRWRGAASGTVTLPLARLHATETAAMGKPGRQTRKRSK